MNRFTVVRFMALMWVLSCIWTGSNGIKPKPKPRPELIPQLNNSSSSSDLSRSAIHVQLIRSVISKNTVDFVATISLGKQQFRVIFDTAIDNIWVPKFKNEQGGLHFEKGHDCAASSTCIMDNRPHEFYYRSVKMSGNRPSDLLHVGGVTVGNVRKNFVSVSEVENDEFKERSFDGVIGMNLRDQAETGMQEILAQLYPTSPGSRKVALWFNGNTRSSNGGQITIGGVDSTRFIGSIDYLESEIDWELKIKSVKFGNLTFHPTEVRIDTGSFAMTGPRAQVEEIYGVTRSLKSGAPAGQEVDCRQSRAFPNIEFELESERVGSKLVSTPARYITRTTSGREKHCYLNIEANDFEGQKWTLGTGFLTSYYTVFDFDKKKIGFAQAIQPTTLNR